MSYTKESGTFLSHNKRISCVYYVYTPESTPKAVVQIVHGMCEYVERYEPLIEFLTSQGYVVCGEDHPGHGRTAASPDDYGYFDCEDSDELPENVELLRLILRKKYRALPYILLGHSMGSFIVRRYAAMYGENIDGLLVSGTSGGDVPTRTALILTRVISLFRGWRYRSKILNKLTMSGYNTRFEGEHDRNSWLTRDKAERERYAANPMCSFIFTVRGYNILIKLLRSVSSAEWAGELPKALPVYLISGEDDPVGSYGAGVRLVYDRLAEAELSDLSVKLYPGARHELVNELNRDEVFNDILTWLDHVVDGVNDARGQGFSPFGESV